MVIVMMLSFTTGVFADSFEQEKLVITLEDGTKVSEREFIEILESYEGEIYKISSETNILYDDNILEEPINNLQTRSTMAMPMDDVMKIMAGTWYIPGVGKVVVTLGGIYVGGVVLSKVSSWIANKVKSWLIARAEAKEYEFAKEKGTKTKNHSTETGSRLNKTGKKYSSKDLKDKNGKLKQKKVL